MTLIFRDSLLVTTKINQTLIEKLTLLASEERQKLVEG